MLPEKSPPPAPYYPPLLETADHGDPVGETADSAAVVSYALTLFTLGVLVGLLAILSRIAQELQSGLLHQVARGRFFPGTRETLMQSMLPPMIADLANPLVWFVVLGFTVASLAISASGVAWFGHGKPALPHERRWTRWGSGIALLLLISAGSAFLVTASRVRLFLLIVPAVGALIGFTVLVLMIVNFLLNPPA